MITVKEYNDGIQVQATSSRELLSVNSAQRLICDIEEAIEKQLYSEAGDTTTAYCECGRAHDGQPCSAGHDVTLSCECGRMTQTRTVPTPHEKN